MTAILLAAGFLAFQADTTTIYSRIGRDTVAVEQFIRTGSRLEGLLVSRAPRTAVGRYVAELGPRGQITHVRMDPLRPDGTPVAPVRYQEATIGIDSIEFKGVRGDSVTVRRVGVPAGVPVIPFLHPFWSYAFYDQALRHTVGVAGDSIPVGFYQVGARGVSVSNFVREGAGAVRLTWPGVGTIHFRFGPAGNLLSNQSLETTFKTEASAGPPTDILRLAADYAARDASGTGLGVLSPRDTARATIGSATISIEYSRPSRRGRTIFGEVVPNGQVWRAGADAATVFTTDRELVAGAARIPAGSYTLWIIPGETGDTLLINSQTGQWGTQHDGLKDLFRLPLRRATLTTPLEQFQIGVHGAAAGNEIEFEWETRRLVLPFRIP